MLANVLYDLEFAEVKGTGIRTMRRLLKEAGLEAPVFLNSVVDNQFKSIYLLHQLMGEKQLAWLGQFATLCLNHDEAKALILAYEIGAVDNAAIRAISDLDTNSASQVLRKLHHGLGLLVKGGAGSATYYQLNYEKIDAQIDVNRTGLDTNASDLDTNASDLKLPLALQEAIKGLSSKPRKEILWPVILQLCNLSPMTSQGLATIFNRREDHLKTNHLSKMRREGLLNYFYPEVINHPDQAYVITEQGKAWLKNKGFLANA